MHVFNVRAHESKNYLHYGGVNIYITVMLCFTCIPSQGTTALFLVTTLTNLHSYISREELNAHLHVLAAPSDQRYHITAGSFIERGGGM